MPQNQNLLQNPKYLVGTPKQSLTSDKHVNEYK